MGKKIKTKIYFFIGSAKSVNNTKKSLKKKGEKSRIFPVQIWPDRMSNCFRFGIIMALFFFFFFFFGI